MYLGTADMLCPPVVGGFVPKSDIRHESRKKKHGALHLVDDRGDDVI